LTNEKCKLPSGQIPKLKKEGFLKCFAERSLSVGVIADELRDSVAQQAAAVLPSPEILHKILRCETKLERQMYRAMNQLERIQRMRQGGVVPPPLNLEV
jgi:hypothetical protein